jgi:hypothetical protein
MRTIPVTLLPLMLLATTPSHASEASSAERFVDLLWEQLAVVDGACPPEMPPPAPIRCGTVPAERAILRHGAPFRVAFAMAERGTPVLRVESDRNRQPQLAEVAGFAPLPPMPGFTTSAWLIGEHRVIVRTVSYGSVDPKTLARSPAAPDASPVPIAVSIEPLDGPFPWVLPAID